MNVSVVMTCFNEGPFIGAAVRSILDQTRGDLVSEVFIADDGSDEATLAVLRDIAGWDSRIHIRHGRGNGLSRNRNRVAAEATGDVIAILDGDDLWLPEKLERQMPLLADPAVGLVYSGYYIFAGDDASTAYAVHPRPLPSNKPLPLAYMLNDPPIIPSTILVRRSVYETLGGFDESIRVFEDTDFYLRAARVCRFAVDNTPLISKRNHPSSLTAKSGQMMMHHAYVAFRFAATYDAALPYVPRRLSQRAAKLGNLAYYEGELATARRFYRLALAMNVLSGTAWLMLMVCLLGGQAGWRALRPILRGRARALGKMS